MGAKSHAPSTAPLSEGDGKTEEKVADMGSGVRKDQSFYSPGRVGPWPHFLLRSLHHRKGRGKPVRVFKQGHSPPVCRVQPSLWSWFYRVTFLQEPTCS